MSRRRDLVLPSARRTAPTDQAAAAEQLPTAEPGTAAAEGPADATTTTDMLGSLVGADTSAHLTVESLPTPYDVAPEVLSPLSDKERADLELCEQALRNLRKAFVVSGKALEVINRGRLYRETHATFADYVWEVWGFKRAHAYRLIEEWPVAVACLQIGDINENQTRELLPVWKTHGPQATVALYGTVRQLAREHGKPRVAANALAEAREALPSRLAAPEQVADVLRVAAAEGRVPLIVQPKVAIPEQPADPPKTAEDLLKEENRAGAEAIAVLEAALAQQQQIYDRLAGIVAQALMYDPGRTELLLGQLRQYANRTAYRARGRAHDADAE